MQLPFECHSFLDNPKICVMEISQVVKTTPRKVRRFQSLLIRKSDLYVKKMELQSTRLINSKQERHYDIGHLVFDPNKGVFTDSENHNLHQMNNIGPDGIPEDYLTAISEFLNPERNIL